jgi:hypothetical protein
MADTQTDIAQYQSDHDLLIELRTEMRGMRGDIKGLSASTSATISDHETRIRLNEKDIEAIKTSSSTWRFMLTTGLTILGVVVAIIALKYH